MSLAFSIRAIDRVSAMNRIITLNIIAAAAMGTCAASAHAQSYNIDFGDALTAPASSYSAAGLPGAWNAIGVPTPGVYYPLVNLAGAATGVTLDNYGGTSVLTVDDPATSGDHEKLLDDMLIGFNNPVDVCIWIRNLPSGTYEVLIYAITPADAATLNRTRVDFANEGPVWIGGAFPGFHQLNLTYSRHTVNVSNGVIGLHSGVYGGNIQSGINGIQVRRLVAGDVNGDGAVNVNDLLGVITAWGPCPSAPPCNADLDGDGEVNVNDLLQVVTNWS